MSDAKRVAESLIEELTADLIEQDEKVSAAIANTNAVWWSLDSYEIDAARFSMWGLLEFRATIRVVGERSSDYNAYGHALNVAVRVNARQHRGRWDVRHCEVLSCLRNFDIAAIA
jgi:hypothetical protein